MLTLSSGRLAVLAALCSTAVSFPIAGIADPATSPAPSEKSASTDKPNKHAIDETRGSTEQHAFFAAHLAALHAGLQLKPDQEGLWGPVEEALQDIAKTQTGHRWRHDRENDSVDALKKRGEHMIARGQAITKLADATGPLVASLGTDQKERLAILLEGFRPARLLYRAFGIEQNRFRDNDAHWGRDRHRFSDRDESRRGDREYRPGEDRDDYDGPRRRDDRVDREDRGGADYDWRPRHRHHHDDDDDDNDEKTTRS